MKECLFALVIFVLLMLGETLGLPVISTPGYLLVRSVYTLPRPYPIGNPDAVHRSSITVINGIFWGSTIAAWMLSGSSGRRRSRS